MVGSWVLPFLLALCRRLGSRHGNFGKFTSWKMAVRASKGYDNQRILARISNAVRNIRNGKAASERDSVTFQENNYLWPVLARLLCVAGVKGNRLNLTGFGGSHGSINYQCRPFRGHFTVQLVSPELCEASYPARFFNMERFLEYFRQDYKLSARFDSGDRANIPSSFKGFVFERTKSHG